MSPSRRARRVAEAARVDGDASRHVDLRPAGRGYSPRRALPLPPLAMAGFTVAVAAVLLIALFTARSLQQRSSTADLVSRSIGTLGELQGLMASITDAETGQRGYLLTGSERYLAPYTDAKASLASDMARVRRLAAGQPEQLDRLDDIERLLTAKLLEIDETLERRRRGDTAGAVALVLTDRGKTAMDAIRARVAAMTQDEQRRLDQYQADWQQAALVSTAITGGGAALLLLLIAAAATVASRDHRARERQNWLREGQAGLSLRLQGEQRLESLGEKVLDFLAHYMDAQAGALYIAEHDGLLRRVAAHAMPPGRGAMQLRLGEGLVGQAAKDGQTRLLRELPEGHLPIASALGSSGPRELLIAPAVADGEVHAVVELGFLRRLGDRDRELLERLAEVLGISVRSAKDRSRLEELLEETQTQAEELQAQQEELRVSNEELEEQGRALKASQTQLETRQLELRQYNTQLGEQTQLLEHQRDELQRSQAVLTVKTTELERANLYKSEFLANMSHELRTPLNSTLILASLLAENRTGNLTPEQVKFAQTISGAGNDLLLLINDILDLSKIEAGKVEVNAEPVPLASFIDGLVKGMRPQAQQKSLALQSLIDPAVPPRIETDGQRLGQILRNLLSNALKFTDRGEVTLTVRRLDDGRIGFAVRDTGIGIAAEHQALVFEAFQQADGSTHRKYGGTGLGLSISRDLARLLGGDISVDSTPGTGSCFELVLPPTYRPPAEGDAAAAEPARRPATDIAAPPAWLAERPPAVPALATPPRPAAPSDATALPVNLGRLILVIEDDQRFAAILRDLALELDFQCLLTHTAGEGLAAARATLPSAIVLDINLPDHSGLGVLDQLKRDPRTRHIPVHVLSVADYAHEAMDLGAVGYDLKPVKRSQLVDALHKLEAKFSQALRRVLVVEDDARQRDSLYQLLANPDVEITAVGTAQEALAQLDAMPFDCMIMDLNLPDLSGYQLLEQMAERQEGPFPPVIVHTGRALSRDEEQQLRRFSRSIIIKDARSPERLLDEVTLFLHQVESTLPAEIQRMLKIARERDGTLEGRRILVAEDDVRNIFALGSVLEPRGAHLVLARNGREALEALARSLEPGGEAIDLVLMDIMMPEMDGLTAMQEIRRQPEWKKLPIIALTAKAMRDDQEKCMAAGASDYIAKPLDVDKLLSLVRVWMPR